MAKDRPSLTTLSSRLARKTAPAEIDAPVPAPDDVSAPPKAAKGEERVQIIVRMTPAERKALRQIALDQDTTAQALAEEAIRDVLRRHAR